MTRACLMSLITLMLEKKWWSDAVWKFPFDGRAPDRTILQYPEEVSYFSLELLGQEPEELE